MKNYLDSQQMKKVLEHITHDLNCNHLTNLVLTANNLSNLTFISNFNLKHLQFLTLSRNKISGPLDLF
jgi:hypothetical protein